MTLARVWKPRMTPLSWNHNSGTAPSLALNYPKTVWISPECVPGFKVVSMQSSTAGCIERFASQLQTRKNAQMRRHYKELSYRVCGTNPTPCSSLFSGTKQVGRMQSHARIPRTDHGRAEVLMTCATKNHANRTKLGKGDA